MLISKHPSCHCKELNFKANQHCETQFRGLNKFLSRRPKLPIKFDLLNSQYM